METVKRPFERMQHLLHIHQGADLRARSSKINRIEYEVPLVKVGSEHMA